MNTISLLQPKKIVFGTGCIKTFADDFITLGLKRLFVLTTPPVRPLIQPTIDMLSAAGIVTAVSDDLTAEPTVTDFLNIIDKARSFGADSVVGIGGDTLIARHLCGI